MLIFFYFFTFTMISLVLRAPCPMCPRPIYQEDQDSKETAPSSSSTRLQWIRSRLPFGRLSIAPFTRIFKTCSRLITPSDGTPEVILWRKTHRRIQKRIPSRCNNLFNVKSLSDLSFRERRPTFLLSKRKSSSASREGLLSIVWYKSGLCKLIGV